jgi:hypothetical protein
MFWEEIWGCVNIIKLPYETVMNMPVQHRKLWIRRHNYENELREEEAKRRKNGGKTISGEAMNAFASMEQEKAKNQKKLLS